MSTNPDGRHLAFPFQIASDGRTATPDSFADHVRDEVLQLILTSPGERAFLPDFGGGARKIVFEPTSDVLRGMLQARLTQAFKKWLNTRCTLENLDVNFQGELVEITVQYRIAGTTDSQVLKFQRTGS
ncbi:MAG TPA: GPW/gp25 family protein [Opitutaceae bacterium]|jgi:phage baseplate assembly protein W|nr:GPW/gp25 family protein [Opitutaceae bacterium]